MMSHMLEQQNLLMDRQNKLIREVLKLQRQITTVAGSSSVKLFEVVDTSEEFVNLNSSLLNLEKRQELVSLFCNSNKIGNLPVEKSNICTFFFELRLLLNLLF